MNFWKLRSDALKRCTMMKEQCFRKLFKKPKWLGSVWQQGLSQNPKSLLKSEQSTVGGEVNKEMMWGLGKSVLKSLFSSVHTMSAYNKESLQWVPEVTNSTSLTNLLDMHYPSLNTAKRGDSMMWKVIGIHYLRTFLEDCFTCCFICTETNCKLAQALLQKRKRRNSCRS